MIDDKIVAIAGFNSALMCGRNRTESGEIDDYGKLCVGESQIYDALKKIEDADIRLSVMHHPFDWLIEEDRNRIESRIGNKCHFILYGHQHMSQIRVIKGTYGDCVIIPAGSCYNRRHPNDTRYTNAYNFVHLNLEMKQGTIFARCWDERRTEWRKDISFNQEGEMQFEIPKSIHQKTTFKRAVYIRHQLEERIKSKYGLVKVLLIDTPNEALLCDKLGSIAAQFFLDHVGPNAIVGLSCGNTINNMALYLTKINRPISLYPISFNVGPNLFGVTSPYATLFEITRKNPTAVAYDIPIPAFFANPKLERKHILQRSDIKELINAAYNPTVAFYSVGGLGPDSSYCRSSSYIQKHILPDFNHEDLRKNNACGEVNWFPISIDGEPIEHEIVKHCTAIPLSRIKNLSKDRMRYMVLVAGGSQKVEPIIGALRGRYLNVLISDVETANRILSF
jgi:DNA-binding transcriptional regulator LsrR (DeoR family)